MTSVTAAGGQMAWQDTTSYSRSGSRDPTTWSLGIGGLRITVTKGYHHLEDSWVMHCSPWFDTKIIGPSDRSKEWAQTCALDLVRTRVAAINDAIANPGASS